MKKLKLTPKQIRIPRKLVIAVLIRAANYVSRGWTQGRRAANANGQAARGNSSSAVAWCLAAAVSNAATEQTTLRASKDKDALHDRAITALCVVTPRLVGGVPNTNGGGGRDCVQWQDMEGRTQADVLWLISQAVKRLKGSSR